MFKNGTMKFGVTDQHNMAFLMNLLQSGKVNVDPLLTHVMALADFEQAFTMFSQKQDNCMKVVLTP